MKKIGIITLSASYNCGSMLQSYALKEILKNYGDVEIINFSSKASHKLYDIVPKFYPKRIFLKVRNGKLYYELVNEVVAYTEFKAQYLEITGKELFAKDLNQISNKYDIVVTGSDQIWNVCMSDFDEAFFAYWTPKKKVAYAPSLGGHDIRENRMCYKYIQCINSFDALSVREEVGKRCLDEITGKDIPKVLDPTLMLDVKTWRNIIGEPLVENNYIFYYSWKYCYNELRQIVSERGRQINAPVYVIDAHKWEKIDVEKCGFILFNGAGPKAFLNLMFYAKECYVESFHGMIFAYLFKKNFWVLDTHESYDQLDSRLKELVELLNIKNRVVTKYNKETVDLGEIMNYGYNSKLERMRRKSKEYLDEVM